MPESNPVAWNQLLAQLAILLPLATSSVLLMLRRDCLSRERLAGGVDRTQVLTLPLLLGGFVMLVLGMGLGGQALAALGETTPMAQLDAGGRARRAILTQLVAFGPAVLWLLASTWRLPTGWRTLGVSTADPAGDIASGAAALVAALPLIMLLSLLLTFATILLGQPIPDMGHDLLRVLREAQTPQQRLLVAASAVICAPVLEEFIFRGLLQSALAHAWGHERRWRIILCAAFVFSLIHTGMPWQVLPPLFLLGVFLGYLYERTGSLWPCIAAHAGFNALNIALTLLLK